MRTARALLSVYYAYMLEYRAEMILWILSGCLPIILMGVWIQAAQGGQFGLKPLDFAHYFITVFIVRQITAVWVIYDFEREVVSGQLSPKLLQPLDPVWHHLFSHIAERFARLPMVFLLVGLFFILYPQARWIPSFTQLFLFTFAVILGFILRFIIQYTLAMLAFWTERAISLENFWMLFYSFLSGVIAPIELFPESVRTIVMFTPFPYVVNFPVSILVGLPVDIGQGFSAIFGWILLFLGINRWLWRAGLKHYSGMGA